MFEMVNQPTKMPRLPRFPELDGYATVRRDIFFGPNPVAMAPSISELSLAGLIGRLKEVS